LKLNEKDISAMLDSLYELFQEYGDNVTPTLLSERMEQKLHRHVHMHNLAYLYSSLGFVTRRGNRNTISYIIPNSELLTEKRAQFCNVSISGKKNKSEDMS
jgi:hypothetical protein